MKQRFGGQSRAELAKLASKKAQPINPSSYEIFIQILFCAGG